MTFAALREIAHGRRLAKRGITAADVLASERPPYPTERLSAWRAKYDRLPGELKVTK